MNAAGHWQCLNCDKPVSLPPTADPKNWHRCPVCQHETAVFLEPTPPPEPDLDHPQVEKRMANTAVLAGLAALRKSLS